MIEMGQPPLGTTIVKNRLQYPTGEPRSGEKVEFLVRAVTDWREDHTGRVVSTANTWTNADGCWRIPLLPWTAYQAQRNTVVEVREGGMTTGHIQVSPPEEGAERWMRDLIVDPPPPPNPWQPISRLADLHDVDHASLDNAPEGSVLVKRGGMWRAELPRLETLSDIDDPSVTWAQYQDPLINLGDHRWGTTRFAPIVIGFGLVDPANANELWFEGTQYTPGYEVEYRVQPGMDAYVRWGDPAQRLTYTFGAAGTYLMQVRYLGIENPDDTAWGRTITIPFEETR